MSAWGNWVILKNLTHLYKPDYITVWPYVQRWNGGSINTKVSCLSKPMSRLNVDFKGSLFLLACSATVIYDANFLLNSFGVATISPPENRRRNDQVERHLEDHQSNLKNKLASWETDRTLHATRSLLCNSAWVILSPKIGEWNDITRMAFEPWSRSGLRFSKYEDLNEGLYRTMVMPGLKVKLSLQLVFPWDDLLQEEA